MKVRVIIALSLAILLYQTLACSKFESSDLPSNAFVIYGDSRTGHRTHQRIVNNIIKTEPLALFHTGDLVEDGSNRAHWARFNEITSELREITEFYPALGNHDLPPQIFHENFNLPNNESWYYVEIDDVHFIILDSNSNIGEGSEQYQWLETDLRSIGNETRFVIVILHHSPFSTGPHVEDEKGLRQSVVPLFVEYSVDVVFSGHDHDYERSRINGISYIVTGGGGAPLYDQVRKRPWSQKFVSTHHFCAMSIIDNRLTISAFDVNLRLIDRFTVSSGPHVSQAIGNVNVS